MDHHIDPAQGQGQPLTVADITEEEAQLAHLLVAHLIAKIRLHLILLELITREDDHLARIVAVQDRLNEPASEGAGPARDQYDLAIQCAGRWRKGTMSRDIHIGQGAYAPL